MSSVERGFVPIKEARSDRVQIELDLPDYVDKDRIGVNLRNIHRLCQIGGIGNLVVIGFEDSDISHDSPTIVGFNAQGTAIAGKNRTKTNIPTQSSESGPNQDELFHARNWANSTIAINLEAVSEKIRANIKWDKDVREPDAWSHYLNQSIREGISSEGTKQLLDLTRPQVIFTAALAAITVYHSSGGTVLSPMVSELHVPEASDLVGNYFIDSFFVNILNRIFYTKFLSILSDSDSRWTLFYGPEPDRALLLGIMSRFTRLVKSIEASSKD